MTWEEAVKGMAKWYENNVNTYQGAPDNKHADNQFHWRDCSLLGSNIQDDCGGFVAACLAYAGIIPLKEGDHVPYTHPADLSKGEGSKWAEKLKAAGFAPMSYSGADSLQAFDIIAHDGHTEIYAGKIDGKHKSYTWGNNHNIAKGGLPSWFDTRTMKCVWRLNGAGNFTAAGNGASGGLSVSGVVSGNYYGIDASKYTNGEKGFTGSSWGEAKNCGEYKSSTNIFKRSSGATLGTFIRQKR